MMSRVAPVVRRAVQRVPARSAATAAPQPVATKTSEEIVKLQDKAKGPWSQLSVEDKTKLYRAAFGKSRKELQSVSGDGMQVLMATTAFIGLSVLIYFGLNTLAGPVPHTVNKSWEQKSEEKKAAQKMNPSTTKF